MIATYPCYQHLAGIFLDPVVEPPDGQTRIRISVHRRPRSLVHVKEIATAEPRSTSFGWWERVTRVELEPEARYSIRTKLMVLEQADASRAQVVPGERLPQSPAFYYSIGYALHVLHLTLAKSGVHPQGLEIAIPLTEALNVPGAAVRKELAPPADKTFGVDIAVHRTPIHGQLHLAIC
jgi:hypothetical protein